MNTADAKRNALRQGLSSDSPVVAVGAHDAMTAQLIDSHGFDAVWVSGFGVSTMAFALPDLNLITMTEALETASRIDAATRLPVIADCDNGYGGFSNVVRTAREYERMGIAGISIEDNNFPKRNSLFQGDSGRALIPTLEQSKRIRAAKNALETDNFVFIARVEALIAGYGVDDALERAFAYAEAGADAVLIHSRDKTLAEVDEFLERWTSEGGSVPLVAVPTLYPTFTADELRQKGFNMVILANQPMRAAVRAIEETLETLGRERKPASVDPHIATVNHVFELVQTKETIELEERAE